MTNKMSNLSINLMIMFCVVDTIIGMIAMVKSGHPGIACIATLTVLFIHGVGAAFKVNEIDD